MSTLSESLAQQRPYHQGDVVQPERLKQYEVCLEV